MNAEERECVDAALHAADAGSAGHWPTVAGWLAEGLRAERARADAAEARVQRVRTLHPRGRHVCAGQMWDGPGDCAASRALDSEQPTPEQQDPPGLFCGNCHRPVSYRWEHMQGTWQCLPYESDQTRGTGA